MGKRKNKLVDKVIKRNRSRAKKDIRQWRSALMQAENIERPRRAMLYAIYTELIDDAHLFSELQKRILNTSSTKFSIVKDGEIDVDRTELFKQPWFYEFMETYIETKAWGHSLLQIEDLDENGEITGLTLIDRDHVVPEEGVFLESLSDEKGIKFREDPSYNNWLLEIGKKSDLGLLNKAAPHVLYKRVAHSSMSEFCEIFGMPLRIGKTNVKDTESLNRMETMLRDMGTAYYAIVDNEEKVEFIETPQSKGEVYMNMSKLCKSEISKLFNGAVIGEDSQGGSLSKEEVGERTGNKISKADTRELSSYINKILIPKLITIGYDLKGFKFRFEETKDIKKLWELVSKLLDKYEIDPEWIKETFGIPVEKRIITQPAPQQKQSADFFN